MLFIKRPQLAWAISLFMFLQASFLLEANASVINVRLSTDPLGFDWNRVASDSLISANIMEGLVQLNADMSIRPAVATSWSLSDDQTTYVFEIADSARWSDGVSLTAQHFLDSWQRLLNPETASSYAAMLFDVVGAKEYYSSPLKKRDFSKVGIKSIGSKRIEITLKHPSASFLYRLAYRALAPIRKDLIEKSANYWADPTKIIVNGPYQVSTYEPKKRVILRRNPLFFGAAPAIDEIQLWIIGDNKESVRKFDAGELDFVPKINLEDANLSKRKQDIQMSSSYLLHFLAFNHKQYPFNLALVRRAFSMAIDRKKILANFGQSKILATSLIPSELMPSHEVEGLPFDPSRAKQLLKEAGIVTTKGLAFDLLGDKSAENDKLMVAIQEDLHRNLGIKFDVHLSDFKSFRSAIDLGVGSIHSRMWSPDDPSIDAFLAYFVSSSGGHKTGWKSERYDSLFEKIEATAQSESRKVLQKNALEILLREECPIVPLFFSKNIYLIDSKIKNLKMRPIGSPYFKDCALSP